MSRHQVGMTTKTVPITRGDTGEKVQAELVVCPDCDCFLFCVYRPEGMNHVHFQCHRCGTSFCDGCDKPHSPADGQ